MIAVALALATCGDPPAGGGPGPADGGGDAEPIDTGGTDIGSWDDTDDGSGDAGDAGDVDAEQGCESDRECDVGVCVDLGGVGSQGFCALPCIEDRNCQGGEACILLINTGGDGVSVCVPVDYCVDADSDEFGVGPGCLGIDCDETDPDTNIGADEVCDGDDNDCDEDIDEGIPGLGVACETGFQGRCAPGLTACIAGLSTCEPISTAIAETCNGLDDDCDGEIDEDATDAGTWYPDRDDDGFGDALATPARTCVQPSNTVTNSSDCDDLDPDVNPTAIEVCDFVDNDCNDGIDEPDAIDAATWYRDRDLDRFGDPDDTTPSCEQVEGYVSNPLDCDDGDVDVNPDSPEMCDGIDNNCRDGVDEDSAVDALVWRPDADLDGYGSSVVTVRACLRPAGFLALGGDCNDDDASVNPDATEVCDLIDNNCQAGVDEAAATDASTWYRDFDRDGFGDGASPTRACYQPEGYVANTTDCNDRAVSVNPLAAEVCDNIDNNCRDGIDEDSAIDAPAWYLDSDGDTWGRSDVFLVQCRQPAGYVARDGDCNDDVSSIRPGIAETRCDGIDDNCTGGIDEGVKTTFYRDADGDLWGNPSATIQACSQPAGYVTDNHDCDDNNARRNPGRPEICDGLDNDCRDGIQTISRRGRTVEYFPGCTRYTSDPTGTGNDLCFGESFNGRGYMFCHYHASFDTARTVCAAAGLGMVDINSSAENVQVIGAFDAQDGESWDDLWLGGRESGTARHFAWVRTGLPFWANGTVGEFASWRGGEPSNDGAGGTDDCVSARQIDFNWNDRPCDGTIEFICEW